jgi:hypothetical protein
MSEQPGWEQQQESEKERWELTLKALDAACEGKATPQQMAFLARECGITNYKPKGNGHASH